MASIGLMGGTFDPPHYGHLAAAETVADHLMLDRVLWFPAGQPPHKHAGSVSPVGHRVEMVRLAIAGNPRFEFSDIELGRSGPSYTADTMAQLHAMHPDDELVFLLGSDEFASLPGWERPDEVVRLAHLAVMSRGGGPVDLADIETAMPSARGRYTVVEVPDIRVSSSGIRQRVRSGLSIRYLVPDSVREYILESRLYA